MPAVPARRRLRSLSRGPRRVAKIEAWRRDDSALAKNRVRPRSGPRTHRRISPADATRAVPKLGAAKPPAGPAQRTVGPQGALSGELARVIGDPANVAAHAADYDQVADFLHDQTVVCVRCEQRWHIWPPEGFDDDIAAVEGVLVCTPCAEPYLIEAAAAKGWGEPAEHRTLYAKAGGVVG